MYNYIYGLLLYWLLSIAGKEDIKKIVIVKVCFLISTPENVPCEKFSSRFPIFSYDTFVVTSSDKIENIMGNINRSKKIELNYGFDTRGKMFIYHKFGEVDSLCLCLGTPYIMNGVPMEFPNDSIYNWINDLKKY